MRSLLNVCVLIPNDKRLQKRDGLVLPHAQCLMRTNTFQRVWIRLRHGLDIRQKEQFSNECHFSKGAVGCENSTAPCNKGSGGFMCTNNPTYRSKNGVQTWVGIQ